MEEKCCKGTKECVVSEGLTFDGYKTCLFDGETIYREQMLFENKKHEVYTVNKYKIALNRDDHNISQGICSGFSLITIKDVFHTRPLGDNHFLLEPFPVHPIH